MTDPVKKEKNHSARPFGNRSTGRDQSTGTNRTGVKPGQVLALSAASLVPPKPEDGGDERINRGSVIHLRVRFKSNSVTRAQTTHCFQSHPLRSI